MVELRKFRSKPRLGLNWESCIFWYYAYKWNLTFYALHCYLNLSRLRLQVKVLSSPHFGSKMIVLGSLLIPADCFWTKNNRQSVRDERTGKVPDLPAEVKPPNRLKYYNLQLKLKIKNDRESRRKVEAAAKRKYSSLGYGLPQVRITKVINSEWPYFDLSIFSSLTKRWEELKSDKSILTLCSTYFPSSLLSSILDFNIPEFCKYLY